MRARGDPGLPLPESMEAAWERVWPRVQGVPDLYREVMRQVFYNGAIAALHQANAGRYVKTATALNAELARNQGLSEHEIIEFTDALMDGTYDFGEGYSDCTPFEIEDQLE